LHIPANFEKEPLNVALCVDIVL